ncbi:MAG: hypothetical protein HZA59_01575 [Hydrogenophilales bacterium]|nr:hypothetical protein [Hydrogenophilales bacterium]
MGTAKQDVAQLLAKLPEDCTLEDVQYHLYVVEKIQRGLDRAEKEGALPQQEAEKRLAKWLTE